MESIVLGLPELTIKKVVSKSPLVIEVATAQKAICPHCGNTHLRTKDSFWRRIRSLRINDKPTTLQIQCHKYKCLSCNRYFNTRISCVKKWSRTTEILKRSVFKTYNKGQSNSSIAHDYGISFASAERYYHQMEILKNKQLENRCCPRVLCIDEHRFTRKQGFATTFCDIRNRCIFDVALGKDSTSLHNFLISLKGREKVQIVCIDMNSDYRKLVKQYFPNAVIVSDRFHVIKLVNHHFAKVCKLLDEEHIAYGRGGLFRTLVTRPDRLTQDQRERLEKYFETQPALKIVYDFCHDLDNLLRHKGQNKKQGKELVPQLLVMIEQLKKSSFKAMETLGKTLDSWKEEVGRMFRFVRNNGITEGFHRKMKLIQRRAYGFRNFQNYRLRVKALCG